MLVAIAPPPLALEIRHRSRHRGLCTRVHVLCAVSLLAVFGLAHPTWSAELLLPRIFGDHMVLQRDRPIPVWGTAAPAANIEVALDSQSATVQADAEGKWHVELPPLPAGGPHTLTVRAASQAEDENKSAQIKSFEDVLIGEVWVCSGQSNMEWSLSITEGGKEEAARADHPQLRMIRPPHTVAQQPHTDIDAQWTVCTPDTAAPFSAVAYYFGTQLQSQLNVPIGLIGTYWGGTRAEAWTPREAMEGNDMFAAMLERPPVFEPKNPAQASVLYTGMLAPIIPYAMRGVIWYQGESNVSRAQQYAELFPTMIRAWRKQWGQGDFPFLFVQLAPFRYGDNDPACCAELWEAQTKTLALPRTGMAVTNDIGNPQDIHPGNKRDVGLRLARWAMQMAYETPTVVSGPLYDGMDIVGSEVRVSFQHIGSGLATRDNQPPSDFTLAGADQVFHPAEARIDGDKVIVTSPQVPRPVAVRFAWRDDAQPNLMNREGLPASAFRSDDFKMATDGNR